MLRLVMVMLLLYSPFSAFGQQTSADTSTAACNFQDGKQMSVRYRAIPVDSKSSPAEGKLWAPGKAPMLLFTQVQLSIGNSEIPVGAYSMYAIPQKDSWTLVVNKNVNEGGQYDQHQDLLRIPMQVGHLSDPDKLFSVALGHVAPQQCNMRMYYGKNATWVEFKEK